jgi:hypothetical protein
MAFQDTYQLLSDSGLYEKILPRSESTKDDDTHLTLRFTEVIPEGTYSLYHRLPSGIEFTVFLEVPFTVLQDHGAETEEPAAETWDMPAFEAGPTMESGDEYLLHHVDDHAALEEPDEWWTVPLYGNNAPTDSSNASDADNGSEAESGTDSGSDGNDTPDSGSGAPADSDSYSAQDAPGDDPVN